MKGEKMKLKDVAELGVGLVVRRKEAQNKSDIVRSYKLLTLKSFKQAGIIDLAEIDTFNSTEILDEKYLTEIGDVVVRLSEPNNAVAITKATKGMLVPSNFVIIRLTNKEILAGYLSIYLNSDSAKKFYAKRIVGTTIKIMQTSILKEIEIIVKPIKLQKKIIEIDKLILKERFLLKRLVEEKELYNKGLMQRLME